MNLSDKYPQGVVLFSGGRDSSLCTCILATLGLNLHLLSFDDRMGIMPELSDIRFEELKRSFSERIVTRTRLPIYGLFRSIAIKNIESDFAKYKKNLILLGSKLAIHASATVYCIQNNICLVADGSNKYQSKFAEQMPEAISAFRNFHKEYGIEYVNPVWNYENDTEVKYRLLEYGISTKSLEGVTVFGDSFSEPSPEVVSEYIQEKMSLCREFVERMTKPSIDFPMNLM